MDAVFAIDFVHAMIYGAAIILLLQLGTIAAFGPSIARAVQDRRELRRLRTDIDVALDRVLPTRHMPLDHHKALVSARTILEAVQADSRFDAYGSDQNPVKPIITPPSSPDGHDSAVPSLPWADLAADEQDIRRWIEIDEDHLGPDHPRVGKELHDLALILLQMGRVAEAEPLIRRALVIAERTLGTSDPTMISYLGNLAVVLMAQNRPLDAHSLVSRAEDSLFETRSGNTLTETSRSVQDTNIDQEPLVREQRGHR